ncbi:MAG: hypothetical protein ND895_20215 [Pyrinomonadaceae bacterium]|nr:hypothetical protein [Pyrinomonadaceae bacterium]
MPRLFIKLTVILVSFALGMCASKVTRSIRTQNRTPAATNPIISHTPALSRTKPIATAEDLGPQSLSPNDIWNFIETHPQANLTKVWQGLQIRTTNIAESQQLQDAGFNFLGQCSSCQAELSHYELDGEPGDEVVLKISDNLLQACRFLIFKSIGDRRDRWRLLGHIDQDFNKYRMADHTVLLSSGRRWLVIKGQASSGTGVVTYFDRVFVVTKGRVREVLGYISEGFQFGGTDRATRSFFGHLESVQIEGGVVSAVVDLSVKYTGDYANREDELPLFAKRQKAAFTRRLDSRKQVLDVSRSDLSESELAEVYQIDSLTEEGFFDYNDKELSSIARGRDVKKKDWLRRYLDTCQDTTQNRRLRQLLTR